MVREILGSVAEFEKAQLVARLRAARERKRAATGRCEGAKPVPAEVVAAARRLARKNPKKGRAPELRAIAAELAELGHVARGGKSYGAERVRRMLAR
jgi:hypothetical protein